MTRYDKILQGGPEELAKLLAEECQNYCASTCDGRCTATTDSIAPCRKGIQMWLNQPAEPDLTEDEKAFCQQALDFDFKWAARDEDGELFVYREQPIKDYEMWLEQPNHKALSLYTGPLKVDFIQWSNENPTYLLDYVSDGAENGK